MVLCRLAGEGEASAGALTGGLGLSRPAVSQHLARLGHDGVVATRRRGATVLCRIQDARAMAVVTLLRDLCCDDGRPDGDAP
jgi:DNA-binding transcriptional ArsR family regulator